MERRPHTTAQGTFPVLETWRDNTSSARRERIFGKIRSLEAQGQAQGMTPARYGIPLLIAVFGLVVIFCAAWGWK